jgi:hypothetical protein
MSDSSSKSIFTAMLGCFSCLQSKEIEEPDEIELGDMRQQEIREERNRSASGHQKQDLNALAESINRERNITPRWSKIPIPTKAAREMREPKVYFHFVRHGHVWTLFNLIFNHLTNQSRLNITSP